MSDNSLVCLWCEQPNKSDRTECWNCGKNVFRSAKPPPEDSPLGKALIAELDAEEEQFSPYTNTPYQPPYYKPVRTNPHISKDADVWDVVHAFDIQAPLDMVVKYVIRAGKKPGEPIAKDITKILECARRALEYAEMGECDSSIAAQPSGS